MMRTNLLPQTLVRIGLAAGLFVLIAGLAPIQQMIPEGLSDLLRSLSIWQEERPEDKVYLQVDRPFYKPGEAIWFTAYVREGATMKPSRQSDIVHVEFIDPKGSVAQSHQLIVKDGMAEGDFSLSEAAPGGLYKIRAYTKWMENEEEPAIFEKDIQVQAVITPRIKMRLDFVREAYGAGAEVEADITFESLSNEPLANREVSYILQVEGKAHHNGNARTDAEGKVRIKTRLPEELRSPDALILVLMNHQGIMESISRPVPVVLNQVEISFFPEGGDLVRGLPGKVAFKAVNAYGEAADISGVVLDSHGEVVSRFSSYHFGMGAFTFTPKAGETYHAALTEPFISDPIYEIPAAMPRGYVLEVVEINNNKAVLNVHSTEEEQLSLVATVRGEAYFAQEFQAVPGKQQVIVDLGKLPMGVAQFTLFDSRTIPRAERLAFVNRERQMAIEIETDKDKYLPRDKVTMKIRTLDDRGMPLPAQVSLAVVDDRIRSFADDRSSTILSWLLVESDIQGEVEEPRFYFDPKEEKAPLALDYLLMTSGWRRFTWREISQQNLPSITNAPEQTRLMGKILDIQGLPLVGARIEVDGITTTTNRQGMFELRNIDLYQPADLTFSLPGEEQTYIYRVGEYRDDLEIRMGQISGIVTDENGEPLIGATVIALGKNNGAVTDMDGRYRFPVADIGEGGIRLQASYMGYDSQVIELQAPTAGNTNFMLSDPEILLEEVVVIEGRNAPRATMALSSASAPRGDRRDRERMAVQDEVLKAAPPAPMAIAEKEKQMVAFDDFDQGVFALEAKDAPVDAQNAVRQEEAQFEVERKRKPVEPIIPVQGAIARPVQKIDAEEVVEDMREFADDDFIIATMAPKALNLSEVRRKIGYPSAARDAAIEGTVLVQVLVDENGKVQNSQIIQAAHPSLDRAVEQQIKNLSFVPAARNGESIAVWTTVPFEFKLEGQLNRDHSPIFLGATASSPTSFYRAREFAAPAYVQRSIPKRRTDFRQTLHWGGRIETDRRGEAEVAFYTSDALTAFHVTVEGIGMDGSIGRQEFKFFSQLPFELDMRIPPLLTALDTVQIPLTLVNNTDETIRGPLSIQYPKHLIPLKEMPAELSLKARESRTILLPCRVDTLILSDSIEVDFRSFGFADAMVLPVKNAPRGFPASEAFSSETTDSRFSVDLSHAVPGSVRLRFSAFPSVSGEIMEGLEGMLREPSGCFEQTSSTTYPNVLVLAYMKETDQDKPEIRSRATRFIANGYQRLMTFESPHGGFEWFGGDPGHEGLTAYGLMEFVDMAKVYEGVDQKMIDRTAKWLLDRRDGEGQFLRNPRALHQFGLSDNATNSIYIAYALSEAGYTELAKEADFAYETAKKTKEPYQVALAANLLLNLHQEARGKELLSILVSSQIESGTWKLDEKQRSAPGSSGEALSIEYTGLAMMAMFKTKGYDARVIDKAATWLRAQRSAYGHFGNTHSTVLALRALIEHAKFSKTPGENGEIEIYAGNQLLATKAYRADD
ncbi:MAG: TonB family protein, partial [Bacteroidia bacterium]|nr:TonB family protein [Bacteroidia bacterium]